MYIIEIVRVRMLAMQSFASLVAKHVISLSASLTDSFTESRQDGSRIPFQARNDLQEVALCMRTRTCARKFVLLCCTFDLVFMARDSTRSYKFHETLKHRARLQYTRYIHCFITRSPILITARLNTDLHGRRYYITLCSILS